LLEPLNCLIKTLSRISIEWDLMSQDKTGQKNEVATLGEFLNMTVVDQLTGIYNRRFLNGHLKKFIKPMSRSLIMKGFRAYPAFVCTPKLGCPHGSATQE